MSLWSGYPFMGVVSPFLWGFWSLGLGALLAGLSVFSNSKVSCVSESLWNNGFSSTLVLLSLWVGGMAFLCSSMPEMKDESLFSPCVFLSSLVSVMFFSVANWFSLYFMFESSLIPILTLILGWGYQPERLQAASHMIMYTVCGSLPLLVALTCLYLDSHSLSFYIKYKGQGLPMDGSSLVDHLMVLPLLGAFLVKSPVFLLHGWLPKAHVEAPVAGSIILSGILLKYGGYGCVLVFYYFIPFQPFMLSFLLSLVVWGGFLCGLMCVRQLDVKAVIAYSSIGHMALSLGGFMTCYALGWAGGLLMMVSHGLCSAGLFGLAGFLFELYGSRSLFLCKGVLSVVPAFSLSWFLFCSSNMGCPPSGILVAEIMVMTALVSYHFWFSVPLGLMTFVAAVYSLFLFSTIQHGRVSGLIHSSNAGGLDDSFMMMTFLLWIPLNTIVGCLDVFVGGL